MDQHSDQKCQVAQTEPGAVRLCALTRVKRPQGELIRFVVGPSGEVVADIKGRLPGRGVWISAEFDSVNDAVARRVFERALKQSVNVEKNLADRVGVLLAEDALQRLSIAKKAGLVVAGFAKVEVALRKHDCAALVHAVGAGEDGVGKLDRLYHAVSEDKRTHPKFICCFTCEQLSLALGRSNVIHAALKSGGAADKFIEAATRFRQYFAGREAYAAA